MSAIEHLKITAFADGTIGLHKPDGSGWLEVAVLRGLFAKDHAAFIVTAVNAHQGLVEALKAARKLVEQEAELRGDHDDQYVVQAKPILAQIAAALSSLNASEGGPNAL